MQESEEMEDKLDPNRQLEAPPDTDLNEQLGYVHYSKDEMDVNELNNVTSKIDRNQYADMITKIILQNDGFNEVATLVTDEEVLIAYEKNGDLEENAAADIAKRSADSLMPSFFEVYVSDNSSLMYDIQSLHNSTTDREYDNLINQLIKEMKKSTQGLNNTNEVEDKE
ncbi:hypothetical protein D8M05_12620 [Oceanobacillus bengalensis]|uniref:Sporulation protein n=2 Tax=Oceanobacillus bengalensis TaxID=1435466 RepID=A0A494YWL1_9BACI|nr:hypothetical protein D8M05_12620 [Oceanobacillus bengalensis]